MYCILLFVTVLCLLYCSVPGEVGSTEIRLYYKVLNCMVLYFTWRDEQYRECPGDQDFYSVLFNTVLFCTVPGEV